MASITIRYESNEQAISLTSIFGDGDVVNCFLIQIEILSMLAQVSKRDSIRTYSLIEGRAEPSLKRTQSLQNKSDSEKVEALLIHEDVDSVWVGKSIVRIEASRQA